MNNILSIVIIIILVTSSFFIGYSLSKSNEEFSKCPIAEPEKNCFELEPWNNAVKIIYSGEVRSLSTSHSGKLVLALKNGTLIEDVQMPTYTSIQDILNRCGDKCKEIIQATE